MPGGQIREVVSDGGGCGGGVGGWKLCTLTLEVAKRKWWLWAQRLRQHNRNQKHRHVVCGGFLCSLMSRAVERGSGMLV
jgi:hypothetical protein